MNLSEEVTPVSETIEIHLEGIEEIEDTEICQVNSYSSTLNGKFLIICTETGIFIVDNCHFTYQWYVLIMIKFSFIYKNGPFWVEDKNTVEIGVKMGALVNGRNEAVIVPNFTNRYFLSTNVYIFDYEMKCILHNIDFFLEIEHLNITPSQILVSNKKRLILYNYLNDSEEKDQKYYLEQYVNKKPNDKLRYLETYCSEYEDQFTIDEIVEFKNCEECRCGEFVISSDKQLITAYIQTFHHEKKRKICLYKENLDSIEHFEENLNTDNDFMIALEKKGQFLAYTLNEGRNINVYSIEKENKLICVLYVSSRVRETLKMEFFNAEIEGSQQLCLAVIRQTNISTATLHIFIIQNKPPTDLITSKYKRYFPLYENILKNSVISDKIISPGVFINDNVLYVYSICGRVFEVIDFKRTGNPAEKTLEPQGYHKRWICGDEVKTN